MNKNIIVTGGCGYIGSHVARAFKYADAENIVTIIDTERREHTLAGIDGFLQADFASEEALAMIVSLEPVLIVHCAGTSLVGPSITDPGEYWDNNVSKTVKMLNVLRHMRRKPRIMFSSSASVYGTPEHMPIVEQENLNPVSPYGQTKLAVERMLHDYSAGYGITSLCFRYFNAAGAMPDTYDLGQEPGATHIIARAIEASLTERSFTINGEHFDTADGTCVRDYVHVWDIALAHVKGYHFLTSDYPQDGAYVMNLGTGKGISNKQIVDYVFGRYGLVQVYYGEPRPGDPAELVADTRMANELLNWTPQLSDIETIIDSAYKWYRSR
jgi:UDP-glucose 4-epimerase